MGIKREVDVEFQQHEKLIWDVIHKLNCEPNEDLYQTGSIGLINAIYQFDETRGFKFSTYASTCIRNEILRSFRGKRLSTIELTPTVIENTIEDFDKYDLSGELLNLIYEILSKKMNEKSVEVFMNYYKEIANGHIPPKQSDMATQLGVSQRTVCRYLKKINQDIIKKWR